MARSNLQIIDDALKLANIIDETEPSSPEESQDGLRRLNDMLLAWERHSRIKLGFYPQTVLADDIPVDDEYFEVITYSLADRLADHYGRDLPPRTQARVSVTFRDLLAEFTSPCEADMDHIPLGSGRGGYNIRQDV